MFLLFSQFKTGITGNRTSAAIVKPAVQQKEVTSESERRQQKKEQQNTRDKLPKEKCKRNDRPFN